MLRIYLSIVLLVLYGDLIKRLLPPSLSLFMLYAFSFGILYVMSSRKSSWKLPVGMGGEMVFLLALSLVVLYLMQLVTSFTAPFMIGLSHAVYMIIPLLYIVMVQKFCPQFNLVALGKIFLLLMIPVNIIGLVQYFIDPNFFVSTVYSGDLGGVILRNFLGGGFFARYPSLFASADRYSAMALMQFYFTLIIYKGSPATSLRNKQWLIFNLLSSFAGLFIAGARSRIIIAVLAFIFMTLTALFGVMLSAKFNHIRKRIKKILPLLMGVGVIVIVIWVSMPSEKQNEESSFPVLVFLMQSLEKGDLGQRVGEAVAFSLLPEEMTIFGHGLGSIGDGKPGEFGIKSIWSESGLFWGTLMLIAFLGIVAILLFKTWKSFMVLQPLNVAIYIIPALLLIFALLAGLTSSFELSTGVLLGCIIAVISRSSVYITGSIKGLPPSCKLEEKR